MRLVRFVGGPLDGQRREVLDAFTVGGIYSTRPVLGFGRGLGPRVDYELRPDHYGPADLVAVVIG